MAPSFSNKILTPKKIRNSVDFQRPVVFTNGVFDILHRGHVTYLDQAKRYGSTLIVAINSDESARLLNKGPERPLNGLEDRLSVLAALTAVSYVTWFEEPNPARLIRDLRPDVLVKGGDWPVCQIVGNEFVSKMGGKVVSIPFRYEGSTTKLINKIKNTS